MSQLNFHKNQNHLTPPPAAFLPVIQRLIELYKLWHDYLPHFPKTSRYVLGTKIDSLMTETAELVFSAMTLQKEKKLPYVQKAGGRIDILKFFLRLAWEIKSLDNKKYIILSEKTNEIGRMIGGWIKQLSRENPALNGVK